MVELRDQLGTTWGTRLRAFGGLWLLLGGLLAALGFGSLVLTATVVLVGVGGVTGLAFWLGQGHATRVVRQSVDRVGRADRRLGERVAKLELSRRLGVLGAQTRQLGARPWRAAIAAAAVGSNRGASTLPAGLCSLADRAPSGGGRAVPTVRAPIETVTARSREPGEPAQHARGTAPPGREARARGRAAPRRARDRSRPRRRAHRGSDAEQPRARRRPHRRGRRGGCSTSSRRSSSCANSETTSTRAT